MTQHAMIRGLVLVLSVVVGLSGVAGAIVAGVQQPAILFMVLLELCVVMCAVFGVLLGRGRFVHGRALALLCVGAGIAVATELGTRGTVDRSINGVSLWPMIAGRFGAAAVYIVLAALEVLWRRRRESLRRLGIGAALALPVIVGAALVMRPGVQSAVGAMSGTAQLALALIGFVVFCALTSAAAHYLITAFTIGVHEGERRAGMA